MTQPRHDSFYALADQNRRDILMMLTQEKKSINSLANAFDISRPAISKHVKILTESGFISIEEKGRERLCSLNSTGFEEVQSWITYFEQFWRTQMKNLDQLLKEQENTKR